MSLDVNESVATKILYDSYQKVSKSPVDTCAIKDTIDFVMEGKNCLTYRYIMFTAVLAKTVNPQIDILSLQAKDKSSGAFDARSLAKDVVFPFQKTMLGNILDGSNSDPLVNKPARFERLRKDNPAAGGDPSKALVMLCDNLPKIRTRENASICVDYIVSQLLRKKEKRDTMRQKFEITAPDMDVYHVQNFMRSLLDCGFGGAALVIVTTALYEMLFNNEEYTIKAHPVNQSGSSKRQFSDLDVYRDEKPFMGTELKDKPYTLADIEHAAETALKAKASSLLFVAGRQSSFASQPPTYFMEAREKYMKRGLYVGVMSIDSLIDFVFSSHAYMNSSHVMEAITKTAESIGAIEAQMWIYDHLNEKTTDL